MKKNKISKNWLIKKHKDQFFKQSKIQGYRSRSAFKLIEMNQKFRFLNNNTYLLDLGSSPGGWTQVVAKKITKGKLSSIVIEYINENHSNALKLRANQLVTKALLNKFLCHK